MINGKYILDGHKPVLCDDLLEWGRWMETAARHVAKTKITDEIKVSTVFLGLDHSFEENKLILFETMVFGGELDQQMERYATWEEAEEGHKRWVRRAESTVDA